MNNCYSHKHNYPSLKRLAIVYLDKGGGIGHCALQLTKVLSDLIETTCYVTTATPLLDDFRTIKPDLRVFEMERGWKSLIKSMVRGRMPADIAASIEADNPDLVLDLGSILWVQVLQRELRGRYPFAELIHDSTPHPGYRYPLYVTQRMLYPSLTDIVVGMSKHGCAQLTKNYPNKLHLAAGHGVILGGQDIDPRRVAERCKKQLFFGQITPYKGLDVLVEAYFIAKSYDPELKLSIVGRGPIKPHLRKRIAELGIALVNEYITDKQVTDLMATHGVLILPYTSATQSGVASVALANGLPAIATSVGALPEQVIDGRNGIIVPPRNPKALANAMLDIAATPQRTADMSAQALAVAHDLYSWESIGQNLLQGLEAAFVQLTNTKTHCP